MEEQAALRQRLDQAVTLLRLKLAEEAGRAQELEEVGGRGEAFGRLLWVHSWRHLHRGR